MRRIISAYRSNFRIELGNYVSINHIYSLFSSYRQLSMDFITGEIADFHQI